MTIQYILCISFPFIILRFKREIPLLLQKMRERPRPHQTKLIEYLRHQCLIMRLKIYTSLISQPQNLSQYKSRTFLEHRVQHCMNQSWMFLFWVLFQNYMVLHTKVTDIIIKVHILTYHQYPHRLMLHRYCKCYLFTSVPCYRLFYILLYDFAIRKTWNMTFQKIKIRNSWTTYLNLTGQQIIFMNQIHNMFEISLPFLRHLRERLK
jgi:hypothetical protein